MTDHEKMLRSHLADRLKEADPAATPGQLKARLEFMMTAPVLTFDLDAKNPQKPLPDSFLFDLALDTVKRYAPDLFKAVPTVHALVDFEMSKLAAAGLPSGAEERITLARKLNQLDADGLLIAAPAGFVATPVVSTPVEAGPTRPKDWSTATLSELDAEVLACTGFSPAQLLASKRAAYHENIRAREKKVLTPVSDAIAANAIANPTPEQKMTAFREQQALKKYA